MILDTQLIHEALQLAILVGVLLGIFYGVIKHFE